MKFKTWLKLREDGGATAGGAGAAAGSSGGPSGSSSVGTSSSSSNSLTTSTTPSSQSTGKGGMTDTKDIAKVPNRCCGWGIWLDPRKKKKST